MTTRTLTEVKARYFDWLVSQVDSPSTPARVLYRELHRNKFVWSIPNDDNRTADGQMLREEFCSAYGEPEYDTFLYSDASFLEVLIALARRMDYETDMGVDSHFRELLDNLGLLTIPIDISKDRLENRVSNILMDLNARDYEYDGRGGLFPLRNPITDQRNVEIWYQMNAYLKENNYV